ncbi:tyrosine-type recombinase/integrase [Paeniglutamicibacter psychrophenolicus]|uniref:Site-specific recombinase XerD n=1 Tax=Paeniglutamicibacter psychrophenolicus TaxID=257454 RepID=A0ABS4WB68_9MICC|nr:tyrosine-type recombinase/integrase [Paeniglutamicibacter psychrophenolicus]MBP2373286.1 site-specific recombinase XerD [Paeniglutamicibacter psychrophenolicus]
MTSFAPLLQSFFTDRLMTQRQASPNTIASYRDTFKLLLGHVQEQTGKTPSAMAIGDLDAGTITGFLTHLETVRGNSVRTRNARLAAIHSLFAYAALRHPEQAAVIQRVLAIPTARIQRNIVSWLDRDEADALLAACNQGTRTGRRDHALFSLAIQTGLRVSELIGLNIADIHTGTGPHVHCLGKGRKERRTPLLPAVLEILGSWIAERGGTAEDPLFTTTTGRRLSRDAIEQRLRVTVATAAASRPSLNGKRVTAHTMRHTAAMRLLQSGVDTTVIALWLGHEQISTTNIYIHADMTLKENAIAKVAPSAVAAQGRYQPTDAVIAFLEAL